MEEQASKAMAAEPLFCARLSMKERQWRLRQDAILDAAVELIQTKGYNAMTLEDITEAIGISRPTLYLHFKSKEDVATHVVIRNLCDIRALLAGIDPSLSPGEKLKEFTHIAVERRFDKSRLAMYDLTRIKLTQRDDSPELRDHECAVAEGLGELLTEAQKTGEIWSAVKPELLVMMLFGFLKNLEIDRLIEDGKTTKQEVEDAFLKLLFDRV
jgi:AcrR family transcriptional regulator